MMLPRDVDEEASEDEEDTEDTIQDTREEELKRRTRQEKGRGADLRPIAPRGGEAILY